MIAKLRSKHTTIPHAPYPLNVLINTNSKIYVDVASRTFCHYSTGGDEEFIEMVYEKVLDCVIDLDLNRVVLDLAIYSPARDSILYSREGSKVEIVEASGRKVHPLVFEGNRVEFGDKLFYVVTNKNEVRTIKSRIKGIVIFVGEIFSDSIRREVMAIIDEGDVYEFVRCKH
ncbi:MAG: DUF2118 domain-containing protein [Ignisphaera sp.]|nr:DUF2118 domain-containing protein [Ignisphaera sp.]MCX8167817.1 DUF2118 domain-containing protein [Ignisphaera sp.]MDW8085818.1 DUF2118 domain-containing protein [Ignisphaera sp.]